MVGLNKASKSANDEEIPFMPRQTVADYINQNSTEANAPSYSSVIPVDVNGYPRSKPGLSIADGESGLSTFFKTSGGSREMNVDGSVTPVVFTVSPPSDEVWIVTGIRFLLIGTSFTYDKYAGQTAGTNGCLFQARLNTTPVLDFTDGFPIKDNSDLLSYVDSDIDTLANKDVLTLDITPWSSSGTTIMLDGSVGANLAYTIRDNFSGILRHRMLARGWIEPSV